jgi:hypothetical protein
MPKKSMIEGSGSRNPKVYLFFADRFSEVYRPLVTV